MKMNIPKSTFSAVLGMTLLTVLAGFAPAEEPSPEKIAALKKQLSDTNRKSAVSAANKLNEIFGFKPADFENKFRPKTPKLDVVEIGAEEKRFNELMRDKDISKMDSFIRSLPLVRRLSLAKKLFNHDNGMVAYWAGSIHLRVGREEEALQAFVPLILNGKDQTVLNGRMGYDWVHQDHIYEAGIAEWLTLRMGEIMVKEFPKYQGQSRKNAIRFLSGYTGDKTREFDLQKVHKVLQARRTDYTTKPKKSIDETSNSE